jgi:hypothetical protein
MNLLLLSALSILLCIPVHAQQSFKPDLSKENIKKVHVYRVNCFDYSGGGRNIIEVSNRGILIAELNKPRDKWVVYLFDLSPILNADNLLEGLTYRTIPVLDSEYDSLYILGKDTLFYEGAFHDSCYDRKIRQIDTMNYLKYVSDTVFYSGSGKIPEVYSYAPLFHTEHYLIHNDKIRYWEDSVFYDYYLGYLLPGNFNSQYKLILPVDGKVGLIDTIIIKELLVNELHEFTNHEFSHLYEKNSAYYSDVDQEFGRTGFIIFKDINETVWFASGKSMFRLDNKILHYLNEIAFKPFGSGFIATRIINNKEVHTLFSDKYPYGKSLSIQGPLTYGVKGYIGIAGMGDYFESTNDFIIIYSEYGLNILDVNKANIIPVKKGWVLLKDYGWIHNDISLYEELEKHFIKYQEEYLNKIVFLAPKNKIMIFDNGKFYELTKKKIKEMGG